MSEQKSKAEMISELVKNTRGRAVRESVVGVALLAWLGYDMQYLTPGTASYYGTLLIIVSIGFIMGVLWSYVIGFSTLRVHPETDHGFWKEAFETQAKLLRTVPLWYLAPILTGSMVTLLPTDKSQTMGFLVNLGVCALIFAGIAWLNRYVAQKLDEQAAAFS